MTTYQSYETERLIIAPVLESDAAFILKLLNTPKWLEFIGDRNVKTEADAADYIRIKMLPQLYEFGYGNYKVIDKQTQEPMGTVGIYHREGYEGADIGYAFLPQFERKGFATEASVKLIEVAFDELRMESLNAYTNKDNEASQKLLRKLGFKESGVTTFPDEDKEILTFTLLNFRPKRD